MSDLVRFGVAMERGLLERFDERIARKGYENRSEALRDLVRADLLRDAWDRGGEGVATITLVYDVSVREVTERILAIEQEAGERVISTLRVHLGQQRCLEVIVARGSSARLRALADRLIGLRGVLSGELVAAAGELPPLPRLAPEAQETRKRGATSVINSTATVEIDVE